MKLIDTRAVPWEEYRHPREGAVEIKPLADGEWAPGINFFYLMVRYGKNGEPFDTPRHQHTFEQFRVPLQGGLNYGPGAEVPEGWPAYFPQGAPYGPQHVESGTVLGVQFGTGYLSEQQKRQAQEELAALGEFRDGYFFPARPLIPEETRVDGMEAMWSHIHGTKMEYPQPRYPAPILMNPEAFDWLELSPGVEWRLLGRFTERSTGISMLRWDTARSIDLPEHTSQLLFVLNGEGEVDSQGFREEAAIWSELGERTNLAATPGSEIVLLEMPAA